MLSGLGETSEESVQAVSVNARVYRAIKQFILVGRVHPGVQLTHEALANELGVSRTPVREALERLHQEGYVAHRRNRGYFVADLSPREVGELFGLRTAIELYALQESWERKALQDIDALRRINAKYQEAIAVRASKQRMLVDQEFHLCLAARSGNGLLVKTLNSIFERVILKRRVEGYAVEQGLQAYNEQEKLLDHLAAGEYEEARTTLSQHIASGRDRLLGQLESDHALQNYAHQAGRGSGII